MEIKKRYLCIFCGKRFDASDLLCRSEHVGMCRGCLPRLCPTPHPPAFAAAGDVDYVISPLFYTGKLRDLIVDFKFNGQRAYADILSALMCDLLSDMAHIADFDCVVPVPLSKKRLCERGYNQSALLAAPFAEFFGIPMRGDILAKTKETKRQSNVDFSQRRTNVQGAFSASNDARGKRILLFDDIFTTGSTLAACADALKPAGARNIAAVTLAIRDTTENISNPVY